MEENNKYITIDKVKIWLKSAAGRTSVILFSVSVILLWIACSDMGRGSLSEKYANNINNILIGISTNLIGIIITVSFVQHLIAVNLKF